MALEARSLLRTLLSLAATVALTTVAARELSVPAAMPTFAELIELTALGVLVLVGTWFSVVLFVVLASMLRGHVGRLPCPHSWRPLVAAACGFGAVLAVAGPGGAAAPPVDAPGPTSMHVRPPLDDLPTLARPTGKRAVVVPRSKAATAEPATIVVRPGDSLWSIVQRRHPGEAAGAIARQVGRLHRTNLTVIGPDPDLIRPGQRLLADDSLDPTVATETAR